MSITTTVMSHFKNLFAINKDQKFIASELNIYEYMRHADAGTGPFKDMSILTQHQRERYYEERKDYSFYINFIGLAISRLVDPIFREEPDRKFGDKGESENKLMNMFMKDCNHKKQSFSHVMKMQARKIKRNTVHFCIVDNASLVARTQKDAEGTEQFPYIYFKSPENYHTSSTNAIGQLVSITFTETGKDADGNPEIQYREWNIGSWRLYRIVDNKISVISEGTTTLPVLPVIPIHVEDPDPDYHDVLVQPELYQLAKLNTAITNISSEIREIERNQGFSILTVPITENFNKKDAVETVVSTKNGMGFDGMASHRPDFISPDADVSRALMEDRDWIKNVIFKLARVVGLEQSKQSGISKEWDFQATQEALEHMANVMEQAETKIIEVVGHYLNMQDTKYTVDYSDNYGVVDKEGELDLFERDIVHPLPLAYKQERSKQYVTSTIPNKEKRDEIIKAIQEMTEDAFHSNIGKDEFDPEPDLEPTE